VSGRWLGVPGKTWRLATLAGLAIGGVYTLSPLTIWFAAAAWMLLRYAAAGLDDDERRWVTTLVAAAIVLRMLPLAALFLTTNHSQVAFGTFFGDEAYYIRRSIWLRNAALELPAHNADLTYAFTDPGWTSHLYVLAFLQTLAGPSPYGVHLFGAALFLAAALVMFRTVRPAFGRAPSLMGLAVLLFLPSLFAWSISALKEPLYFLGTACAVAIAARLARDRRWGVRVLMLAALVAVVAATGAIREGGAVLTGGGILAGFAGAWVVRRPWALAALAVLLPIAAGLVLRVPRTQIRVYNLVQSAARLQRQFIETPGWSYALLDQRFYDDGQAITDMRLDEAARYLARAAERYVTVPLPWEAKSPAMVAYLPEQVIWYALVTLLPIGVLFSLRRDVVLTAILCGVTVVSASAVALLNGNIGTLVRLRVLAIPYLTWLSMVGLCELLARTARSGESAARVVRGFSPAHSRAPQA
jgi:hypothetical protein